MGQEPRLWLLNVLHEAKAERAMTRPGTPWLHHPGYTHPSAGQYWYRRHCRTGPSAGVKECYGLIMPPEPVSNGPILTFKLDYLPFGSLLRPMLQESSGSEGPRVPSSIHSMQHFGET